MAKGEFAARKLMQDRKKWKKKDPRTKRKNKSSSRDIRYTDPVL